MESGTAPYCREAREGDEHPHPLQAAGGEGEILEMIGKAYREAYSIYRELLERGVARELARIVLPLGTYTQFYWTVNSRSLMNFLKLRMSEDAQYEIREYARVIYLIFREKMPWTAEAWEKFGRKNP
jgi:thymidylate synthase (FAD) (EC 2.1.1.148)